ncbi:ABC transporter permease [Pseudoluteimonas lycopersici]|jgi:ABC-2 type transport system permease protein|uniref:Transport permease protein n=1 Tax=Pseudoluteimonas lycopersici TaxID=1324796 RepID=A0A516V6Z9_9GAMM|nr:ABC transporter permease [Lysobacter lycopersici]QDQ74316.1 ABC transporter permease [Lysobacter lycopersici]
MNAAIADAVPAMPRTRVLNAYWQEGRSEVLRYLRNPGFLLPVILFPNVFYAMFGIVLNHGDGEAARYMLASYTTFGVMAPGLFGFGVSLALERDGGLLTFKRALPMPPGAYLLGKMLMALCVAAVVCALLLALAFGIGHVPLAPVRAAALLATGTFGVLPFCALGLFVGTLLKGQGAPGLLNMVYLPMAFLSGLWFPLHMMPGFLQRLAPVWPSTHLNALSLSAVGFDTGARWPHVAALAGFTAAFLLLAARRLRRHG